MDFSLISLWFSRINTLLRLRFPFQFFKDIKIAEEHLVYKIFYKDLSINYSGD